MAKKKAAMSHNGRPCKRAKGGREFDDGSFVVQYTDELGGACRAYPKDVTKDAAAPVDD